MHMYGLQDLTDRQHFNLPHSINIQSIPETKLLSKGGVRLDYYLAKEIFEFTTEVWRRSSSATLVM